MTDFRKLMSIINEAQIEAGHAPPENEEGDAAHYGALDNTGFFGKQAAGAILMAKTTGRILIVHRSEKVLEPLDWGNVGGAYHADEDVVSAVRREIKEETGYVSRVPLVPLFVYRKGSFKYSNFLGLVDDEFEPHLGWEAIGYEWCDYGNWPSPLHFGLVALFADPESEKTIKHYASLYRHSDEHPEVTETLDEDMVVTPNIANTMATQAATQAASSNANGNTPAQAPAQAQGGQGSVSPAQGSIGTAPVAPATPADGSTPQATGTPPVAAPTPAPGTPTTTAPGTGGDNDSSPSPTTPKSLAPITSQ